MKIDFDQKIKALDGNPIKYGAEMKDATMQVLCRDALLGLYQDEQNLSGSKKFERYELARKLAGEVELKTEEISVLKELVGKNFPPIVVGPVYEILEGKN